MGGTTRSTELIVWNNAVTLARQLGFTSKDEMYTFMNSNRFAPYFEEYARNWIYPAQQLAKDTGVQRGRGPQLDQVEQRFLSGEQYGSDKYSNDYPDMSDWDQWDHAARLLYRLGKANTSGVSGLFYGKGLKDSAINAQVWALIKHAESHLAPSKAKSNSIPRPTSTPFRAMSDSVAQSTYQNQSTPSDTATTSNLQSPIVKSVGSNQPRSKHRISHSSPLESGSPSLQKAPAHSLQKASDHDTPKAPAHSLPKAPLQSLPEYAAHSLPESPAHSLPESLTTRTAQPINTEITSGDDGSSDEETSSESDQESNARRTADDDDLSDQESNAQRTADDDDISDQESNAQRTADDDDMSDQESNAQLSADDEDMSVKSEQESNAQVSADDENMSKSEQEEPRLDDEDMSLEGEQGSDTQAPAGTSNSVARIDNAEVQFEEVDDEDQPALSLQDEETLTAIQRMIAECPSEFTGINLNYRFWRAFMIRTVTNVDDKVDILREKLDIVELNRVADIESHIWMRDIAQDMESSVITYQPFDEAAVREFDEAQSYFDNTAYQREDLRESCELLGIPWAEENTIYRMTGMALSVQFHFWQPVAIKAIWDIHTAGLVRACILGDGTGIGKTWEIIGFLLLVRTEASCL